MKDAVTAVFADLQAEDGGDHAHLKAWARSNPTEFYRLWARLTAGEASGPGVPAEILKAFEKLTPEHRSALRGRLAAALK